MASPAVSDDSGEDGQAGEQQAAAPEQVAEAASEQEEAAVGEDVAAGHPLQVLLREAQAVLDGRQGDVDDRRVGDVEELHGAQQHQGDRAEPRPEDQPRVGVRHDLPLD